MAEDREVEIAGFSFGVLRFSFEEPSARLDFLSFRLRLERSLVDQGIGTMAARSEAF